MQNFQEKLVESITTALEEVTKRFGDEVKKIPSQSNPFTATRTDNLHVLTVEQEHTAAGTLIQPVVA